MRDISIQHDDIFWRFYCKRFTIVGKKVESPKNLCRYFWTSVVGFGLWLRREVRLSRLWLICLLANVIGFAISGILRDTGNIFITVVSIILGVLLGLAISIALLLTIDRVFLTLKTRAPWILYFVSLCFIGTAVIHVVTHKDFYSYPELIRMFKDLLRWMGYATILAVVIFIITFIISGIPQSRLQRLQRFLQTIGAFISAKKRRVCPSVNPPEDFKVKP